MRRIVSAPLAVLALLLAGLVSSPAHATWVVAGCDETGTSNRLDLRTDYFHSGHGVVVTGFSSQADFKVSLQTQYFLCQRVADPDKIQVFRYRVCAEKLDNEQPVWFQPTGSIQMTGVTAEVSWNTDNDAPINGPNAHLDWNGKGVKGDKECGPFKDMPALLNRWLWMSAHPYVVSVGTMNIANARDTSFPIIDDDTNSIVHKISPYNDTIVSTRGHHLR